MCLLYNVYIYTYKLSIYYKVGGEYNPPILITTLLPEITSTLLNPLITTISLLLLPVHDATFSLLILLVTAIQLFVTLFKLSK